MSPSGNGRPARAPRSSGSTEHVERRPLLPPELAARVRRIQIRTHRLVSTALAGGYRSTFRGSGLEFDEVRPYQPGDDVRSIDWNVTARTGEPYVKRYVEERELTLHLFVDTSRSMDFGSRQWSKRESAAHFAALIALVAMRHSDRVGLHLYGERPGLHLPAKKGPRHALRVVREVLAAEPSEGASDLAAAFENARGFLRRRAVLFVVSDFLEAPAAGPAGREPWDEALAKLARRHDVIAVRVQDPFERELPAAGRIALEALEEAGSGALGEVDTRSRAVREAWARAAAARDAELSRRLLKARVDRLELDTSADVGERVLGFFRRRAQRHGGRPA